MYRTTRIVALVVAALLAAPQRGVLAAQRPSAVEARAVTQPSHDIEVVSPVGGVIQRVLVKEGDTVEEGQPLVELDAEVEKASLAISEHRAKSTAAIEAAAAKVHVKRVAHERQKMLRRKEVASDADVEEAELEHKHAEAELTAAKEQQALFVLSVARDQTLVAQKTIRAPLAGIVTRCMQDVGEAADEFQPLVRLVVIDVLHVIAYVPPDVAAKLRPGMAAQLALDDAPKPRRPCRVLTVDPVVDAASGTTRVKLELPNPKHTVAAGSRATVFFDLTRATEASARAPAAPERRP